MQSIPLTAARGDRDHAPGVPQCRAVFRDGNRFTLGQMEIRLLQGSDVESAMRLSEAAGWNQTRGDWERLLELAPPGCFGIDVDGTLAATTTAVCYGRRLAWIGMVLTLPEFRGRGLARRLMRHALDFLDRTAVEWVKLDATDMGRPLYAKLGFKDDGRIERWHRPAGPAPPYQGERTRANNFSLDVEGVGTDRSGLLAALEPSGSLRLDGDGFAMARPGRLAAYFGPCEARHREAIRPAVDWFLDRHAKTDAFWDLFPANEAAVQEAMAAGFSSKRVLTRMVKRLRSDAVPLVENRELIYAAAGFEFG